MSNNNPGCLTSFFGRLFTQGGKGYQYSQLEPDPPEVLPYLVRDDFLSAAEASFFHVLQNTLQGKQLILSKVSLGDLFYVSHPEENLGYYNKINRKHVDFLLCDPKTLKPTLGIELDDSSHKQSKRIIRDEFVDDVFATAGLPLVRVPVRPTYSSQEIVQLLKSAMKSGPPHAEQKDIAQIESQESSSPPFCPKCGERMILRIAQRGQNAGQRFFGCPNYPKCREVIPVAVTI